MEVLPAWPATVESEPSMEWNCAGSFAGIDGSVPIFRNFPQPATQMGYTLRAILPASFRRR